MKAAGIAPERWKLFPSGEGLYEVSDQGRIRRVGSLRSLKGQPDRKGYLRVHLNLREKRTLNVFVACAVLETFKGPRPSKRHQACHEHGDNQDNRLCKLRWGTPEDNWADRRIHGTDTTGERHPLAKLTAADVRMIRVSTEKGVDLARRYGVSCNVICKARLGRSWRCVP